MKRLQSNPTSAVIAITSTQLIGPQDKRHCLVISAPNTGRITLGFGRPAVLDQGITLYPGAAPLYLLYAHIGGAIREEINAIASVSSQTIGVLDLFWP